MEHSTTISKLGLSVAVLVLITVSSCGADDTANLLLNPGAEQGKDDLPSIWFKAAVPADGLRIYRTTEHFHSGKASLAISNTHKYDKTICNNWAQLLQNVPIGKTILLSAYIKTENADAVNVCVQCWGPGKNPPMLAFASTPVVRGDQDWTLLHSQPITVPPETASVYVRAALTGLGKVWLDDLSLVVVDTSTKAPHDVQLDSVENTQLTKIIKGKIVRTLPLTKDCMILKYIPKWAHGNIDNIAVANNDGGVRTLLAWPQLSQKDAEDPNQHFIIALYSRQTTSSPPVGTIEAHEILKDWPERTSWETQPPTAEKPVAKFKFVSGNGWKLFDITSLLRDRLRTERKCYGLMLRFAQENRSGNKRDWSGYAFVSREGTGQWLSFHPSLLIVDKVK
jgi:hypothetical protein